MHIDCHTHTTRYSACSTIDPDHLCSLALKRGLDAVVITEHHHQWTEDELASLSRGYPGLRVYAGMEVSVREGYDVVVIGTQLNALGQRHMPIENLVDAVADRRDEVFLFVAHPFRFSKRFDRRLTRVLDAVDGIEMNSVNIMRGHYVIRDGRYSSDDDALYERALQGRDLVRLYNSDAHSQDAVGAIMSRIEGHAPENEAALASMLKTQQPDEVQNSQLLETCLSRFLF